MTAATLQALLGWSALINYIILLLWFIVFAVAHDWMYRLHGRWFNLRLETFDALHYGGMAVYKLGIFLLNLVPFLVLYCLSA